MGNSKSWFFRLLILAAGGLLVLSWFMPWWSINVFEIGKNAVVIHPWGLETNLRPADYELIKSGEMPSWFAPIMFTYLGIAVAGLILGIFAKNKEFKLWKINFTFPSFIIGLVGFSYIFVVILAVIIAAIRTGDFWNLKLIGYTYIDLGEPMVSGAEAGLLIGYWLACASGVLLLLLGLFRRRIIGRELS